MLQIVYLDVSLRLTSREQATNTNRLVGDNREGKSVMSKVLPSSVSAADHNLRFAPQWTAPEMLRTPLGV